MGLLIFYIILVLVISFSCSILEATLLSTPLTFVTMKEEEGATGWRTLKKFKQDIDRPISAILTLNTIANTAGAAAVGFQTRILFDAPEVFGWISGILTFLILVCSEIIPKTLGATYWRHIIMPAVPAIQALVFITWPFVKLAEYITQFIQPKEPPQTVSREEVSAMLTVGAEEGVFKQKEDLMIVVEMVEESMTVGEFREEEESSKHSRIPVYRDNDDYVTGYVLRQHILESLSEDKFDLRLSDIARPILSFQEKDSVSLIWEKMLEKKEHISAVIDEYGCLRGIVTMEDVIETMLGTEIVDENDTVEDMQEYAREQWKEQQEHNEELKNNEELKSKN